MYLVVGTIELAISRQKKLVKLRNKHALDR